MHTGFRNKLKEVNNIPELSTGERKLLMFDHFMEVEGVHWGSFRNVQDQLITAASYLAEVGEVCEPLGTLTMIYELLGELEIMRTEIR